MDNELTPYGRKAAGNVSRQMLEMWNEVPKEQRNEIAEHFWWAVVGIFKRGIDLAEDLIAKMIEKIREWIGLDDQTSPATA